MLLSILFLFFHQNTFCQKMKLALQITNTEKSKDSHSSTERWHLDGLQLSYSQSFTGRLSGKKEERKNITLTTIQVQEIEKYLGEKGLFKNIPSPKYSEFMIPYSATNVHLSIQKNEQELSDIHLYDISTEIVNNEDYKHILALANHLKKLFN
jgi:hypothetical protein